MPPGSEEISTEVFTRAPTRQLGNCDDIMVAKIFFGDASRGQDGRYMETRSVYGSLNLQEGTESYHRLDETSLYLFEHNGQVPEYKGLPDSPLTNIFRDCLKPRSPNITDTNSRPLSMERLLGAVFRLLHKNLGYSLVVGLHAAQELTDSEKPFRLPEFRPEIVENSVDGLIAATVNGISALRGSPSATYAKQALLGSILMSGSLD